MLPLPVSAGHTAGCRTYNWVVTLEQIRNESHQQTQNSAVSGQETPWLEIAGAVGLALLDIFKGPPEESTDASAPGLKEKSETICCLGRGIRAQAPECSIAPFRMRMEIQWNTLKYYTIHSQPEGVSRCEIARDSANFFPISPNPKGVPTSNGNSMKLLSCSTVFGLVLAIAATLVLVALAGDGQTSDGGLGDLHCAGHMLYQLCPMWLTDCHEQKAVWKNGRCLCQWTLWNFSHPWMDLYIFKYL